MGSISGHPACSSAAIIFACQPWPWLWLTVQCHGPAVRRICCEWQPGGGSCIGAGRAAGARRGQAASQRCWWRRPQACLLASGTPPAVRWLHLSRHCMKACYVVTVWASFIHHQCCSSVKRHASCLRCEAFHLVLPVRHAAVLRYCFFCELELHPPTAPERADAAPFPSRHANGLRRCHQLSFMPSVACLLVPAA